MKKITHKELASLLASKPGAFPVGIVSRTDSKALKTGNPYGKETVYKLARGAVWTGVDYERGVNKEAQRQGLSVSFKAGPLPEGREWVTPNKVLRNLKTGGFMLRTQSQPKQRLTRSFKVTGYETASGKPVPAVVIAPFIPKPAPSRKQEAVGLQADEQTEPRDYNFSSLLMVRISGVRYCVVAD